MYLYFLFAFTFIFDNTIEFAKLPTKNEINDANKIRGVLPKIFTIVLTVIILEISKQVIFTQHKIINIFE